MEEESLPAECSYFMSDRIPLQPHIKSAVLRHDDLYMGTDDKEKEERKLFNQHAINYSRLMKLIAVDEEDDKQQQHVRCNDNSPVKQPLNKNKVEVNSDNNIYKKNFPSTSSKTRNTKPQPPQHSFLPDPDSSRLQPGYHSEYQTSCGPSQRPRNPDVDQPSNNPNQPSSKTSKSPCNFDQPVQDPDPEVECQDLEKDNNEPEDLDEREITLLKQMLSELEIPFPLSETLFEGFKDYTTFGIDSNIQPTNLPSLDEEFDSLKKVFMEPLGVNDEECKKLFAATNPLQGRSPLTVDFANEFGVDGMLLPCSIPYNAAAENHTLKFYINKHIGKRRYDGCRSTKELLIDSSALEPEPSIASLAEPDVSSLRNYFPNEMVLTIVLFDRSLTYQNPDLISIPPAYYDYEAEDEEKESDNDEADDDASGSGSSDEEDEKIEEDEEELKDKGHKPPNQLKQRASCLDSLPGSTEEIKTINKLLRKYGMDKVEKDFKRRKRNFVDGPPAPLFEYEVLSNTSVKNLCDLFLCEFDNAETKKQEKWSLLQIGNFVFGDLENQLVQEKGALLIDKIKPTLPEHFKSSVALKCWNTTKLDSLTIRFGAPYRYFHNECQHFVTFTESRVPRPGETEILKTYPTIQPLQDFNFQLCPNHAEDTLATYLIARDNDIGVHRCQECADKIKLAMKVNKKPLVENKEKRRNCKKKERDVKGEWTITKTKFPVLPPTVLFNPEKRVYVRKRRRSKNPRANANKDTTGLLSEEVNHEDENSASGTNYEYNNQQEEAIQTTTVTRNHECDN